MEKNGQSAKQKSRVLLITFVALFILITPLVFASEKVSNPNAIINLEGINPGDQIVEQNGIIEIGSSNVVESVTNTLIEQGLVTPENESKGRAEASNKSDKQEATSSLPLAIDKVFQNISQLEAAHLQPLSTTPLQNTIDLGRDEVEEEK